MSTSHHTAAIILAAGSSSRMGAGRHKLLLPLHDRPVLAHVLDAVLASQARPNMLILGHQAEQVRTHIAAYTAHPEVTIIENPDYLEGMSTSLRLGIQTLQAHLYRKSPDSKIDSALVLLGDQVERVAGGLIDGVVDDRGVVPADQLQSAGGVGVEQVVGEAGGPTAVNVRLDSPAVAVNHIAADGRAADAGDARGDLFPRERAGAARARTQH